MSALSSLVLATALSSAPLQAPATDDRFGLHVRGAGDVNGDGSADLLVGDLKDGPEGSAWVLSGKTGRILHHFRGGTGTAGETLSIYGFDALGDVTGDGRPDVYLRLRDRADPEAGYARLCSGADGSVIAEHRSAERVTRGRFVRPPVWCLVGDLDGDGVPDVAVGDPHFEAEREGPEREGSGRVLVESGRDGRLLLTVEHPPGRHGFGSGVAASEDLDGDGLGELRVRSRSAADAKDATWSGTEHSSRDGRRLELRPMDGFAVGDLDGDGRLEFLERDGPRCWQVVTREGRPLFEVAVPGARSATALSDVNGDGRPDFAVGDGGDHGGTVWLVSGADGSLLHTYLGEFGLDAHLGDSLDRAGDVDGDGVEDVIAGGVYTLCCDHGRARVISGATGRSLHFFRKRLLG